MSIRISYSISDEEYLDLQEVRGGIQILIDRNRLNKFHEEETHDWKFDWRPEFAGEWIDYDIKSLLKATIRIAEPDSEVYDAVAAPHRPIGTMYEIELLSKDHLRIAFKFYSASDSQDRYAEPTSARGMVVDRWEFVHEVDRAVRSYRDQLRSYDAEFGLWILDDLGELIDELEHCLDDAGETSP